MSTYNSLNNSNYTLMEGEYEIPEVVQTGGARVSGNVPWAAGAEKNKLADSLNKLLGSTAAKTVQLTAPGAGSNADAAILAGLRTLNTAAGDGKAETQMLQPAEFQKNLAQVDPLALRALLEASNVTGESSPFMRSSWSDVDGDLKVVRKPEITVFKHGDKADVMTAFPGANMGSDIPALVVGTNEAAVAAAQPNFKKMLNRLNDVMTALVEYVAFNVNKDTIGNYVRKPQTGNVNSKYSFLPMGDRDTGYENHSQTGPDILDNIAQQSMTIANYTPLGMGGMMGMPGALMVAHNREGAPRQEGGGAIVLSNTMNRKSYCSDSNFLFKEWSRVAAQLKSSPQFNLSERSKGKVKKLGDDIKDLEEQLCEVLDTIDNALVTTKADGDNRTLDADMSKEFEIESLLVKKDKLVEAARKAKVRFFSTIVTVTDLFKQGASQAIKEAVTNGRIAPGPGTPGVGVLSTPAGYVATAPLTRPSGISTALPATLFT